MDVAKTYAVYRFAPNEKIDIESIEHLIAITPQTFLALPYANGAQQYTYVVTSLDRMQNESKGKKVKVKL